MARMWRAADARFKINGVLFAVQEWQQRIIAPRIDVSNTESYVGNHLLPNGLNGGQGAAGAEPCRSFLGDIGHLEITLNTATWDSQNNPYIGAFLIRKNTYVTLQWYPNGLLGVSYGPLNMLVEECSHRGRVGQGAQPFSCVLVSDGEFVVEARA